MAKRKSYRQIGFGARFADDDPHVPVWTILGSAKGVREAAGRQWCQDDPANGWKAARIEGARVVKVEIKIIR